MTVVGLQPADDRLRAPSAVYLPGTDHVGRDLLSRLIRGARLSLTVGLAELLFDGRAGRYNRMSERTHDRRQRTPRTRPAAVGLAECLLTCFPQVCEGDVSGTNG